MFLRKISILFLLLSLILIPQAKADENEIVSPFSDVSVDSDTFEAIKYLYDNDIVKGRENGLFSPTEEITRVEALKIIFDLRGIILQKNLPINQFFPDVDNDKWYAPYVFMAKSKKTMSGTKEGFFEPDRNITRAESCKIVLRTYGIRTENLDKSFANLHDYEDIEEDKWYSKCIGFISFYDLYKIEENNFNPDLYITREELASFVYKMNEFYNSGNSEKINPNSTTEDEEKNNDLIDEEKEINMEDIPDEYKDKLKMLSTGIASYYSDWFNGKGTASGATFNNDKMIAAHPILPFNSFVKVTNIETGESAEVEILDCGPFVKDRIIDLSSRAFNEIHQLGSGLADVKLEVVKLGPGKWQDKCFELTQKRW